MAVQQEIAFEYAQGQVGRQMTILLDQPYPERRHVFIGRTYADAPEIDSVVYVTGKHLQPDSLSRAKSWQPRATTWWRHLLMNNLRDDVFDGFRFL